MQFNLDETGRQSIYIREETFWDLNATAARGSMTSLSWILASGSDRWCPPPVSWQQCLSVHTSNPAGEGFSFPWVETVSELLGLSIHCGQMEFMWSPNTNACICTYLSDHHHTRVHSQTCIHLYLSTCTCMYITDMLMHREEIYRQRKSPLVL